MKSVLLALAATVASAAASITIVTPWSETTWMAGGQGNITWTSSKNDTGNCEIQLMNGNASNANMVAYVTSPGSPVSCSTNAFNIYPLNDFASGKYWIRVGERESNSWAYSGVFNFEGKGTAKPLQSAPSFDNTITVSSSASVASPSSSVASASGSIASASGSVPVATGRASAATSGVPASASSKSDPASSGSSSHRHSKAAYAVLSGTAAAAVVALAL